MPPIRPIRKLGGRSMRFKAAIFLRGEDEPSATAQGVLVWYDFANQRSATLPRALRDAILTYEATAPEQ